MDMRKVGPAPLDPKVTKQLLDLLSTDDTFRQLFKSDAATALAQVGYSIDVNEASAADCMQLRAGDRLASKAQFIRDRDKLEKALSSIVGFFLTVQFKSE